MAKGSTIAVKVDVEALDLLGTYCEATGLTKRQALSEAIRYFMGNRAPDIMAAFQKQ